MTKRPPTTDEERLDRIRELKARIDADRAELLTLIPAVFPEKRGEEPVRGRLTEVVKATGWTRAHITAIRDGKVKG
jgi:hypothetical protein